MHFAEMVQTIKARRQSLKITQETLAELSGVSLRTLKQFESGKGNPSINNLQKLVDVLGFKITLTLKTLN